MSEDQTRLSTLHAELEHTRQELAQTRQQLDSLLYTLSHDLRTPAMTALGFADLLASDLTHASPSAQQYLEHIRNSANRQIALIEQLIRLSQLLREPMHVQPLDMSRLCADAWNELPQAAQTIIKFDIQTTPAAVGDAPMLKKMLHLLIDNAIKFTSHTPQPRICFTTQELDGVLWYALSDNGVGFPEDSASRLFQPFRRLHPSKQYPGIGMGLATAALIVQRHHGQITAQGATDAGATIRFRLGNPG